MTKGQVEQVRRFNRTVAERVGVLHDTNKALTAAAGRLSRSGGRS